MANISRLMADGVLKKNVVGRKQIMSHSSNSYVIGCRVTF